MERDILEETVAQVRYDHKVESVARNFADQDDAQCLEDIDRLMHEKDLQNGVIFKEFPAAVVADALREKGFLSARDEEYQRPAVLEGLPHYEIAAKLESGQIKFTAEDIRKEYFAHVIEGCEHPTETFGYTFGHENYMEELYAAHDIAHAQEKPQEPELPFEVTGR